MLRLQYERIDRRFSQGTLARLAGMHQPAICLIEQGRLQPTPVELARLAQALGIHPPSVLLKPVLVEPVDETVDAEQPA